MNFTDLDEDVICVICKELSTPDQLALVQAFEYLQDWVVSMVWRHEFRKYLAVGDARTMSLGKSDNQMFFKLIAPYVQELTIDFSVSLDWRPEIDFYFNCDISSLRILRSVHSQIRNEHIQILSTKCSELEELEVRSPSVTGIYLIDMINLKKLTAYDCNLIPEKLLELLRTDRLISLSITFENVRQFEGVLNELPAGNRNMKYCKVLTGSETNVLLILDKFRQLDTVVVSRMNLDQLSGVIERCSGRIKSINWNLRDFNSFIAFVETVTTQKEDLGRLIEIRLPYAACQKSNDMYVRLLSIPSLQELHLYCYPMCNTRVLPSLVLDMISYLQQIKRPFVFTLYLHYQYELVAEDVENSDFMRLISTIYASPIYQNQRVLVVEHDCISCLITEKGFVFW